MGEFSRGDRRRRSVARWLAGLSPLALFLLSGCATDWVTIRGASASSPSSTTVWLSLDVCHPTQAAVAGKDVTESAFAVRVRLSMDQPSGDVDDCSGGMVVVELQDPIADRIIVDDRTAEEFIVQFPSE